MSFLDEDHVDGKHQLIEEDEVEEVEQQNPPDLEDKSTHTEDEQNVRSDK